jgi:hypothetical protein
MGFPFADFFYINLILANGLSVPSLPHVAESKALSITCVDLEAEANFNDQFIAFIL